MQPVWATFSCRKLLKICHTHIHAHSHYTLTYTCTCSAEERGANNSDDVDSERLRDDERVDIRPVVCLGRTQVAAAVSLGQIGVRDTSKARNTYAPVHNRTQTHTHAHTSSLAHTHTHRETSNVARVLLFQVVPTDRRRRRRRGSQMRNKHVRVRSL